MRNLFYIIVLLLAAGCNCSAHRHQALDQAEALMGADPSQALSELNALDVSEFQDSATVARWALLYSEALAANGLCAPTDTIINIAVDYYGRHGLDDSFRKASLLKTQILVRDQSDALATALYLQKEKEFFLYHERATRRLYTFVSVAALLAAAGIIIWMRQRMKIQSLRTDSLMAEASALRCRAEAIRGDVCRLETKLHGLLENRFALIDSLCQTYYESQGTKAERKAIVEKVKSEIESVRTDSFGTMEQAVNDCRDNLLVRVQELVPGIKPNDYQLLVYIACGLSTQAISLLLDESVEVIYKRKSRLKSNLRNSVSPVCPDIMTVF